MMKSISVANFGYEIEVTDKCPICHHYCDTQIITHFEHPLTKSVQVIFQCVFTDCKKFFIGDYPPKNRNDKHLCRNLKPRKPETTIFSESLAKISPQFISIYAEAEEAKSLGLDQIAGPGYRKAFEFLIKDYAMSLDPKKSEDIKNKFSASVVNEFIPDKRIQSIAKRTLWLGNDESHYLKKWTSHDMDDLIALIRLTTDWIDIEQVSKKYCEEMPEEKDKT